MLNEISVVLETLPWVPVPQISNAEMEDQVEERLASALPSSISALEFMWLWYPGYGSTFYGCTKLRQTLFYDVFSR